MAKHILSLSTTFQSVSQASLNTLELVAGAIPIYTGGGAHRIKSLATLLNGMEKSKRSRFNRALQRAEADGVLTLSGDEVRLSQLGRQLMKRIELEEIKPDSHGRWGGLWQIVAYDIPDTHRPAREAFRQKLSSWGFRKIQESVWAYPYECKEIVAIIAREYYISDFVLYLHATDLPQEKSLKKYYKV